MVASKVSREKQQEDSVRGLFRETVPRRGDEVRGGSSVPCGRVFQWKGSKRNQAGSSRRKICPWHLARQDHGLRKRVPQSEQRRADFVKTCQGTPWDRLAGRPWGRPQDCFSRTTRCDISCSHTKRTTESRRKRAPQCEGANSHTSSGPSYPHSSSCR